jgi:Coenzyme PQQ synthesis protein D (PqqD)
VDELVLEHDSLMWREVDGEVIVLDKRTWTYMGINGSGAVLWKDLAEGAATHELVERLRSTYGIDAAAAARDVEAFLALLRTHKLLAAGAGGEQAVAR